VNDRRFWFVSGAILVAFVVYWLLGHPYFITSRIVMFFCIIASAGAIIFNINRVKRGEDVFLRTIPGLKAFEEAVGRSTEMGKPVLYVPGIVDMDQVETVTGVILMGHVARLTARYETPLHVPVARSIVMKAGRESVKESYLLEGRPDLYQDDMVHYLTDDQFAYAAGVNGIMLRERPAACFYQGKFYAESLILAETGNSIGAIQIAGTASAAQIPFFVTACDYTLIGEEFFAASAYLSGDPGLIGGVKGMDILKTAIVSATLLAVVLRLLNTVGLISFNVLQFLTVQ